MDLSSRFLGAHPSILELKRKCRKYATHLCGFNLGADSRSNSTYLRSSRVAWVQVPYTPHRASPNCKPCLQYSYCRFARHVSLCRWLGSTGMFTAMMHPFRKSPPGDPNSTLFLVDRSGIHPVERTEKSDKNQITQAKSPRHILAGPATSIHNRTRLPRLPRVRWGNFHQDKMQSPHSEETTCWLALGGRLGRLEYSEKSKSHRCSNL